MRRALVRALVVVLGLAVGMVGLAGPAAADDGGNQRFWVFLSESDGEETNFVVAVGPITGVGTFEEDEDPNLVHFHFPQGSVTLFVPTEEESEDFNELTCSGSFSFSGPWEIVSGTGAYRNASGSGRFSGTGHFFGDPTNCDEEAEGGIFFLNVFAHGNVSLGGRAAA
jgi:hypothetical protein